LRLEYFSKEEKNNEIKSRFLLFQVNELLNVHGQNCSLWKIFRNMLRTEESSRSIELAKEM
jgi:hypothetical protein